MSGDKQKFRNVWIWTLMILLNAFLVYCLISQIFYDEPVGNQPVPDPVLIGICFIPFAILVLLKMMYLRVDIRDEQLVVEYFPFLKKRILISDIMEMEQVTYRPIHDYGGWGIRFSGKGSAYTINGNLGFELKLVSGEIILIGVGKYSDLDGLEDLLRSRFR